MQAKGGGAVYMLNSIGTDISSLTDTYAVHPFYSSSQDTVHWRVEMMTADFLPGSFPVVVSRSLCSWGKGSRVE